MSLYENCQTATEKDTAVKTNNDTDSLCEYTVEHDSSQNAENNLLKEDQCSCENEKNLGGPLFYPPLYIQRYTFVKDILDKLQPASVVDFGSAECGIFRHLKEVRSLKKINLVDIDSSLLEINKYRIRPQCFDYLQKRKTPLHVQIFDGSATKFDTRLVDCDAVIMVEFIEHLYEDDLKEVIKMVFECIVPKFVVMTTPNYEFNQLFPEPKKFRHYDHKFEWTRSEFQSWCRDICEKYGYSSEFHGIGDPPIDSNEFGCCSQAAVLTRKGDKQETICDVKIGVYTLVAESKYPHQDTTQRSAEDILESELKYVISFMSKCNDFHNEDDSTALIPVERIWMFRTIKSLCDLDQIREFLLEKNYTVSKNDDNEDCVVIDLYPEDTHRSWYDDDLYEEDQSTIQTSSEKSQVGETMQNYDLQEEFWD